MTEPKEDTTDSPNSPEGLVIHVRRKPGRPKISDRRWEKISKKRKNESLLRKELAEETNTTTSIQRPRCRKNKNTSKREIS